MKNKKGITLVEIILYVAILGFISTAFISMSMNMMSLKSKSSSQQEVDSSLQFISQKINYEIRNAKSISGISGVGFTLTFADTNRNPTIFDLNNGNIRMGFGVGVSCPTTNPCILNSNKITISNFTVNNLSSGDSQTQNIHYSITANFINNSSRPEFDASGTITDSIEIRSK